MPNSRMAHTRIRLTRDGAARRDLIRLQHRATGASLRGIALAADALDRSTRMISVERAGEVARLARALTREADRIVALGRLRELEAQLVERGFAEWLEATP